MSNLHPRYKLGGRRFGRLIAICISPNTSYGKRLWRCKCNCGSSAEVATTSLLSGATRSCGCLSKEVSAENCRSRATHSISATPLWNSWNCMVQRCTNPRAKKPFGRYGAKGIKICRFLQASPLNLKSAIGDRPKGKSIDRIDNNGSYTCGSCAECRRKNWPMNVRWASSWQQARNTSKNHFITIAGHTMCLEDWAKEKGVRASTIFYREKTGSKGLDLFRSRYEQRRTA